MCHFFPAMKPGQDHAADLVAGVQQRPYHFIVLSSNWHFLWNWSLTCEYSVDVISYCPGIQSYRAVIHDPLIQCPDFRCMSSSCSGHQIQFNDKKHRKQEARILEKLRHTEYMVTREGNSVMDVKEMLKREGIKKVDIQKLPGAKLQKWNLYTEEKLKRMTAKGDSYEDIKTVRS